MLDVRTDPVCGMQMGSRDAFASASSDGERFYFCCFRCEAAFLDTPHRYAGWAGERPRETGGQSGWSELAGSTSGTTPEPGRRLCQFAS